MQTRPIYHKCDDTIREHVFRGFLALVLLNELQTRLEVRGWHCEWERLKNDLDALENITVVNAGATLASLRQAPFDKLTCREPTDRTTA